LETSTIPSSGGRRAPGRKQAQSPPHPPPLPLSIFTTLHLIFISR